MFCIIHDTLELFGGSLEKLRTVWEDEVRPKMPARTAKTAMTTATELFENVTDVIRELPEYHKIADFSQKTYVRLVSTGWGTYLAQHS